MSPTLRFFKSSRRRGDPARVFPPGRQTSAMAENISETTSRARRARDAPAVWSFEFGVWSFAER